MTEPDFWRMVDSAVDALSNSEKAALAYFKSKPVGDLQAFVEMYSDISMQAYNWKTLLAACLTIGDSGGCGDDAFAEYRKSLVELGEHRFKKVVLDPDAVAEMSFPHAFEAKVYAVAVAAMKQLLRRPLRFSDFGTGNPRYVMSGERLPICVETMKRELPKLWEKLGDKVDRILNLDDISFPPP